METDKRFLLNENFKEPGHKLVAEIVSIKTRCGWGHKGGDSFPVGIHTNGGMCGTLYHACFPHIMQIQFGGEMPPTMAPPGVRTVRCADLKNSVQVRIRRVD